MERNPERRLKELLAGQRQPLDAIIEALEQGDITPERLDELDELAFIYSTQVPEEVAELKRRRGSLGNTRILVVEALDEGGFPLDPTFLTELIWATRRAFVDPKRYASLRRDEMRAWDKAGGADREAYVTPALRPDGEAQRGWLSRSDWPLERRIVLEHPTLRAKPGALEYQKLSLLLDRRDGCRKEQPYPASTPFDHLLRRYAWRLLRFDSEADDGRQMTIRDAAGGQADTLWVSRIRDETDASLRALAGHDEEQRLAAARELRDLDDGELLWGRRIWHDYRKHRPAQAAPVDSRAP
jgi:hypothetical protein